MEWYQKYDNKPLLEFASMAETDEPRILVISGPPGSGKSLLTSLLCGYMELPVFDIPTTSLSRDWLYLLPFQSVLRFCNVDVNDAEFENVVRQSFAVIRGEKQFRRPFHNATYAFLGNQCIIETTMPVTVQHPKVTVFNLALPTESRDKVLDSHRFRSWILGFDQSCREAVTFILVARSSSLLSRCPKDVLRLLVVKLVGSTFTKYWGKDLDVNRITF